MFWTTFRSTFRGVWRGAWRSNPQKNTRHDFVSQPTGRKRKYKLELPKTKRTLEWSSRRYPTCNPQNWGYLFRSGPGLSTMLLKGSFSKATDIRTGSGVIYTQASDMAKDAKFQTDHLFELQIVKMLLRTAYTGGLPKVDKKAATQLIEAPKITEENILTGWHKRYPSNIDLNPVHDPSVKGMPENYRPPENTPADRVMTALGDWGNLQNLVATTGDINPMKGDLLGLRNLAPVEESEITGMLSGAPENHKVAAEKIEATFQGIFLVFEYINDPRLEPVWRQAYKGFNQEVVNMDLHMPELKGMKAIWEELWPAYQRVVAQRAYDWVLTTSDMIERCVPPEMAALNTPLGKLVRTAKRCSRIRGRLNWKNDYTR